MRIKVRTILPILIGFRHCAQMLNFSRLGLVHPSYT